MTILIMIAQLILGLSILVILHELGHFLTARAFGIKVEKFYLFFDAWGFKLFKIKIGDTEYGIGWLPLGGYVKIAGMIDESMDKEQMKKPVEPWEFRAKPAWQRLIVMVGGVTVNMILGVVLFTMMIFVYEKDYIPADVYKSGIYARELGKKAGFKNGDKIIEVNGKKLVRLKDAYSLKVIMGAEITVERDGKIEKFNTDSKLFKEFKNAKEKILFEEDNVPVIIDSIIPKSNAEKAELMIGDQLYSINDSIKTTCCGVFKENLKHFKNKEVCFTLIRQKDTLNVDVMVDSIAQIGVDVLNNIKSYPTTKYSFGQSIYYGWKDAMEMLFVNIKGLGKVFKGEEKASESVSGPIGIAQIYGGEWIWEKFWFITGILSLVLAFMNILPIPALDGGHVIFLLIEVITGKKFSDKFMEKVQTVGMIILLTLMTLIVGLDIFKLFK